MFSPKVFTEINRGAILAFWHEIRFNQAVRKANRDMYRNYFKEVEQVFAQASKTLDIDIDTSSAAHGLIAIIDGLWLKLSIDDREISRKRRSSRF